MCDRAACRWELTGTQFFQLYNGGGQTLLQRIVKGDETRGGNTLNLQICIQVWSINTRHPRRFANDEYVTDELRMRLRTQLETFFANGVWKLEDWSKRCVEKLGNYFENYSVFLALCVRWNEKLRPSWFPLPNWRKNESRILCPLKLAGRLRCSRGNWT